MPVQKKRFTEARNIFTWHILLQAKNLEGFSRVNATGGGRGLDRGEARISEGGLQLQPADEASELQMGCTECTCQGGLGAQGPEAEPLGKFF